MAETVNQRHTNRAATRRLKAISMADLGVVVGLPFLVGLAWFTPARWWPAACRKLAPLAARFVSAGRRSMVGRVQRRMGNRQLHIPADAIVLELLSGLIERNLHLLRDYHPGRWRPAIRLDGREHIDAALSHGKGVILWDSHFMFSGLVTKMALSQAGFSVSHLSHPRHGFSSTRFGMGVINRVRTNIESRYLRERVVMSLDGPVAAMRLLYRRLKENGMVSVTVRGTGQTRLDLPFLADTMGIATGAPDLAYAAGAPLLPVFTVRDASGTFVVTVEPPLDTLEGRPRRESSERAARHFVERLEGHVARHPGQWLAWLDR